MSYDGIFFTEQFSWLIDLILFRTCLTLDLQKNK
jgi:hypothetical protein